MIKVIIFDYAGVLSLRETRKTTFVQEYAKKYGIKAKEFIEITDKVWQRAKVSEVPSIEYWQSIANLAGIEWQQARKDLIDSFGWNDATLALAKQLKKKYRMAILSNQIEDWFESIISKHNLRDIFEVIITSYDAHLPKPDKRIFILLLEKLGVEPEECVFIDDEEKNIKTAIELGMHAIQFKDINQLKEELKKYD